MLFRKDIEPRCTYCRYAAPAEPETVICRKKGVRSAGDHCRSFRYDPLRRMPSRPAELNTSRLSPEDFQV